MEIKRILITGISGYIGSHLAKYLNQQEYQVIGLIRKETCIDDNQKKMNLKYYIYDGTYLTIDNIFKYEKIDLVIHLASFTCYDYEENTVSNLLDSNIKLGTHLLVGMSKYQCKRIINTGSFTQYSDRTFSSKPVCLYAATKSAFEKILDYFVFDKKISAITINLFDVYGENDRRKKLFTGIKAAFEKGEELSLTKGEQFLKMTYIGDVLEGYKSSILSIQSLEVLHKKCYVNGDRRSLKEVVRTYMEITGRNINLNWGQQPYRKNQIMNPIEVGEKIGPDKLTSLENGIKELYEKESIDCNSSF